VIDPERTGGLRNLLKIPFLYFLFQRLIGVTKVYRLFVSDYLTLEDGDRLLDVGCGPCDILGYLPNGVEYVGIDANAAYISAAQKRFGSRGSFYHCTADMLESVVEGAFDVVIAFGLLHHLDDSGAEKLIAKTSKVLNAGGQFVFIDPCYTTEQSWIAKWLISRDRGTMVRTPDAYRNLAAITYSVIELDVRFDLVNIPWTHSILKCQKSNNLT